MSTIYRVIEKGTEEGKVQFEKLYSFLKDASYFVTVQRLNPQADIPTYRGAYFAKLQMIAEETGHNKKEMHEIVKEHLIAELYDKNSTKQLTPEEWVGLLKAMELWAFQTYEIVLP